MYVVVTRAKPFELGRHKRLLDWVCILQALLDSLDNDLRYAIEVEGKQRLADIENYEEAGALLCHVCRIVMLGTGDICSSDADCQNDKTDYASLGQVL